MCVCVEDLLFETLRCTAAQKGVFLESECFHQSQNILQRLNHSVDGSHLLVEVLGGSQATSTNQVHVL